MLWHVRENIAANGFAQTHPDIIQSKLIQMQFSSFLFELRFLLFLSSALFLSFFHRGL